MTPITNLLASTALLLATTAAAFSQSADPAWLEDLNRQLAEQQQCEVEYYVNLHEGELGGMKTYDARAQCRDGRQFDASRIEPAKKFVIKPCGTVVC